MSPVRYRVAAPTEPGRHPSKQAKACHSLVVRSLRPIDTDIVNHVIGEVTASWHLPTGVRLWEERLNVAAESNEARDRVRQESGRPLNPVGSPLRAVLFRYADGMSDLVLVARRPQVPGWTLRALAERLLGPPGADPVALPQSPTIDLSRAGETRPELEWGLGDPARAGRMGEVEVELPSPTVATEELLLGAIGLVLSRYGAGERTSVGVLDGEGTGAHISVRRVGVDGDETAAAYLERWSGPYGDEPLEGQPMPVVGVVRSGAGHRPYLAAVLPITVHAEFQENRPIAIRVLFDEGETSPASAQRFATHLAYVAGQLAADPHRTLNTVELLTEDEIREVLDAGNTPMVGDPERACQTIHGRFAQVARTRPDALALTAGATNLTYAELDARAEQLAAGLQVLGVARGSRIGVALERDSDLIVALLAVLKADCAYVPMDVEYPEERLRYTVDNAGATVVIVGSESSFPTIDGVRAVTPAELCELGTGQPGVFSALDGSDAAYVIYTSGSTGRPKGVVVPHRNVGALIEATRADFEFGPDDAWTLFHSSAFDFSVWEIWGCLLTGGRLVVVPYWITRDTELFHELLVNEKVTVLNQTPSAFAQLIETDRQSESQVALRLVVFGGEPLDVRMLAPWFARYSHTRCRLVNMFGITETTVHVTAHTVTPADVAAGSRAVGAALPGWTLSIRDPEGRVLPPGVAGEICVGGLGVADRYLGQPELTDERFVEDPHGGGRIYRSGDRGRLRPQGILDHLGRLDSQVKVRGYRIELDEIRNVLLRHPAVAGAAVVLNHDRPGDAATARLDAYVVLRDTAVTTGELVEHARRILPSYMLPTSATVVDSIPLTINGKLDAARLSAPSSGLDRTDTVPGDSVPGGTVPGDTVPGDTVQGDTAQGGTVPARGKHRDAVADAVLGLWSQVLNTEVTPEGNFFELGGNSLLVIRVLREMRNLGLPKVAIRDFYRNSTGAEFIEHTRGLHV